MINRIAYTFTLIIFFTKLCFAFDAIAKYEKDIPLAGGQNTNKNYLQSSGASSDKLTLRSYFGSTAGYLVGIVYSRENANYYQIANSSRISNNFSSTFNTLGLETGIWIQLSDSIRHESGISLTSGSFNFKNSDFGEKIMNDTKRAEIYFGLSNTQLIYDHKVNFNVNIGYYKVFLTEFEYNGVLYNKDELAFKQYLVFTLGLGVIF